MKQLFRIFILLISICNIAYGNTLNLVGLHTVIGIDHYPIENRWIKLINKYDVSGVVFISNQYKNPQHVKDSIEKIKKSIKGKYPVFFCVDQEGGRVNRIKFDEFTLKSAREYGDSGDIIQAEKEYAKNAKLLSQLGININFSPVLDVARMKENAVIGSRSYSRNPNVVSTFSQIVINTSLAHGVIPVAKHFPGHGQPMEDSHAKLPVHSDKDSFEAYDMSPFLTAIDNNLPAIMVGHVLYPHLDMKYPASLSNQIVSNILSKELNFNGIIFSDDINMGAIKNTFSLEDAWKKSVIAGVDQVILIASFSEVYNFFKNMKKIMYPQSKLYGILLKNSHQIITFKKSYINNN